jgi:integrase
MLVRFGSKADIRAAKTQVRFILNSDRESGFPHKVMSALPPKADIRHSLQVAQVQSRRRDVILPDILVDVLREYRKAQLELRMRLGAGRPQDGDLLFADLNGAPLSPNAISAAWSDYAKQIGMPEVTFHSLRHTHASQLIDAGVDRKRLGHAKPDITLRIYDHLFRKDDGKAAAAINAILK